MGGMKEITCVVTGGGHVGLHALKEIGQAMRKAGKPFRLILIDPKPFYVQKVLLFQPAARAEKIALAWEEVLPERVERIQGELVTIESQEKRIFFRDAEKKEQALDYDLLVITVGSVVKRPDPEQGGISLHDLSASEEIRTKWRRHLQKAVNEQDPAERKRLLSVAVAGAGISGVETSAELAQAMRSEAARLGMDPALVRVFLINAEERLMMNGPKKLGRKLEAKLNNLGVTVLHQRKALYEKDGKLVLSDGTQLSAGFTIWTLGLEPHPVLRQCQLPLTLEGKVKVDASYRVSGKSAIYSIGDCAHVIDPENGKADGMTCKEGILQAKRLGEVIEADLKKKPAPIHRRCRNFFCISLGQKEGLVWAEYCGIDWILAGKIGRFIRKWTWKKASNVK